MNLVDSSVWVDYFRAAAGRATAHLRESLGAGEIPALTEPIAMELLAGAQRPDELARVQQLTDGLPMLSVVPELDYRDAATLYRAVRANGKTVRRLNDCLIAAIAMRNDIVLVHKDVDFEAIGECVALRHLSVR